MNRREGRQRTDNARGASLAGRVTAIGLVLALLAVAAQTVAHLVDVLALGKRYEKLDATRDGTVFDWTTVAAVSAAACLAAARAVSFAHRRRRFAMLALAASFLALDDALGLHERVGAAATSAFEIGGRSDALFLVPYFPGLAVVFLLLASAMRDATGTSRRAMKTGLVLLVAAILIRIAGAVATVTGLGLEEWEKALGMVAMRGAELGAWLLLATGLAASLCMAVGARNDKAEVLT